MSTTTNYNSLIAFMVKETGWSLEYIRSMPFSDLMALAAEFIGKLTEEVRRDDVWELAKKEGIKIPGI